MKQLTTILFLLHLVSCVDQTNDKPMENNQARTTDTTSQLQSYSADTTTATISTVRFLDLVKYLDSSGFIIDTARFKKSYKYPDNASIHPIGNYVFYDVAFENTIPYQHIKRCERDRSEHMKKWCSRWGLDIDNFAKTEKIIQYFFVDKNVNSPHYKGEKYFVDGLFEEWKFPDNNSARKASEDLGARQEMVYVNRGGFVCYRDNYMYVFHSRASNFMYSIRPFYRKFVSDNNAITTNEY